MDLQDKSEQFNTTFLLAKSNQIPFTIPQIIQYASDHPTPFHIYDENTIRQNCARLKSAFSWAPGFKNYFAVKATPNPNILSILKEEGFGFDVSSLPELYLAEAVGAEGEDIYFTSNNTPIREFAKAKELGAIINLDDISHVEFIRKNVGLPNFVSFRYNPALLRSGDNILRDTQNSKFGLTKKQILEAYALAKKYGVDRFALHTMVVSNCRDEEEHVETAKMMFELVLDIYRNTGIRIEAVNLGGGIGIPYKPGQPVINLESLGAKIKTEYERLIVTNGLAPIKLFYEAGRLITGPSGFIISRIIHKKETYKSYLGVDASMTNLMRPSLYNSYHHITVVPHQRNESSLVSNHVQPNLDFNDTAGIYDVVGSLCENNDKLATDRYLGSDVQIGDLIVIHDTGAHGHAMGFNYNGKLRSAEYLVDVDRNMKEIRRAETCLDLFSTLQWLQNILQ